MTTQTSAPTTNLYDVLDIEPTSTPDEIRAAWRAAVADLDPTDRRFRVYNQAAEVLLDPLRRAAYDEQLERGRSDAAEPPRNDRSDTEASSLARPNARRGGVPAWSIIALAAVTSIVLGFVGVALATPSGAAVRSETDAAQAAAE